MTSEVAILNRSAVALAADSAVTVKNEKVWNNTNKLFSVSDENDIGVMVFGNGAHCSVSWEIMVKRFRKSLGNRRFQKFDECVSAFDEFIRAFDPPNTEEKDLNVFSLIVNTIDECCVGLRGRKLDKRRSFSKNVDMLIEDVYDYDLILNDYEFKDFIDVYDEIIANFSKEQAEIHLPKSVLVKVSRLCFERVCRRLTSSLETGIVFAGYGEEDIFPVVEHFIVDGVVGGKVRIWSRQKRDLNTSTSMRSYVVSFAQSDIAQLFMEGIQPEYLRFFELALGSLLDRRSKDLIQNYVPNNNRIVEEKLQEAENEALVASLMSDFHDVRADTTTQPMLRVIASLPKEEMAAMAEAIVEVTSLKRKMDSALETVGGPVDVALISKADGFVWIKRKHYFSTDLNKDFVDRRSKRYGRRNDE